MKESLISFKTAKLAKEKGFENTIPHKLHRDYYTHKGELNGDCVDYIKAQVRKEDTTPFLTIDAPTQSLLQKWLREKHNIILCVEFILLAAGEQDGYRFIWSMKNGSDVLQDITPLGFLKYEEALEEGLQKALKLI